MKKIRIYAITSIDLLVLILLLFSSCEKSLKEMSEPLEPPVNEKLVQWKWDTNFPEWKDELQRDPLLYKDLIITGFASDYQNRNIPLIVALDKRTGEKKWEYSYPNDKTDNCRNVKLYHDYLLITFTERIVCLSLVDRSVVWERVLTEHHSLSYPFDIYGEYMFIAEHYYDNPADFPFNDSVSMMKYHIPTGQFEMVFGERGQVNTTRHPQYYPCAKLSEEAQDIIFFTREFLDPGKIHTVDFLAVDLNTKQLNWIKSSFSNIPTCWNTPPFIFNGNVIVASDWSVYSFDAMNGSQKWRRELTSLNNQAGFSFSGPFLHNNLIYAVENDGHVFCIDAQSGNIKWQITNVGANSNGPARGPCIRPIVVDGILFINAWSDQALVLIDANSGIQLERHKAFKFNGRNVLYDEETQTFFVTADDQIRAFTIKK